MGHLDDIQITLKPLRKSRKKLKKIFIIILGHKIIQNNDLTRPDTIHPIRPDTTVTLFEVYFSEIMKDRDVKY